MQMLLFVVVLAAAPPAAPTAPLRAAGAKSDTAPVECAACESWNAPQAPFRIFGNAWYVGRRGLSAVLVTTPAGHFLLDGALPQSASAIAQSVEALGFRVRDVRWIAVSHAHFDHVGGVAALQRMSGARVITTAAGAAALRRGGLLPEDPQFKLGDGETRFPAVANVVVLGDSETVSLGGTTLVLRATPGHTPGGATWTWRSCENGTCRHVVYADSLNPISAAGFRFTEADGARVAAFRQSIERLRAMPCDVLIAPHPELVDLFGRLEARKSGDPAAFIDASACRTYADAAARKLERRVHEEGVSP